MFKQAVKTEAKLRLAIAGPSGSGKTYTALAIATNLGDRVAVVDTEHGSASKYADIFNFDTVEMHSPFMPQKYMEAIKAAVELGYNVLVMDSMSHAWNGSGGMLEMVEKASKRYSGNSYAAWGDVTPIYQQMIEAIVSADLHIICTMRSKQDYVLVETSNGKTRPQKVGMAPIQRDGFEYEFDVFLDLDIENNAIVQKTRCPALTGQVFAKPGADVAAILKEWLVGEPERKPDPPKPRRAINVPEVIQPDEVKLTARDDHEMHVSPGDLTPPLPTETMKKKFHKLGVDFYGDAWDDERPRLVTYITNKRQPKPESEIKTSNDLYRAEMQSLIDGLENKIAERAELEAALEAENKDALGAE